MILRLLNEFLKIKYVILKHQDKKFPLTVKYYLKEHTSKQNFDPFLKTPSVQPRPAYRTDMLAKANSPGVGMFIMTKDKLHSPPKETQHMVKGPCEPRIWGQRPHNIYM